ncbi:MAG: integrase arm-type DNA-binding domain-containing protein [Gammaproteobacteria bacterium]|nr:integrase arm-type DNA-binding domain-containing protein [Gammaproteobacteria bacterium]
MANKLTAAFVQHAKPGKYTDGNGLILRVMPSGSKQWVQRLTIHGQRRDMGLGGFPLVTLAEAREQAFNNRKLARAGGDPLALRQRPNVPTFADAAEAVIAIHEPNWKGGARNADLWRASLRDYVMPKLGNRRVDSISTADVMGVLMPIWNTKHETARRVRQRISSIMKWSVAQGHRQDNPAGDAISEALPKNRSIRKHQRALPHAEVARAIAQVRGSGASPVTQLAFEFLVLTAARTSEVRLATWEEVDLEAATWTVPAERMKAKREHRVPLSGRALEILDAARSYGDRSGYVFPSPRGNYLSKNVFGKLLLEMDIGAVPHGFRSSFRDWGAEKTNTPREVMEAALAHVVRNQVEAAYARTDLFERRRRLMEQWAAYLAEEPGQVVSLYA